MPYSRNSDLPSSVKVLPSDAQSVWRSVFNENADKGEESAIRIAWGAVKNAGWAKNKDGEWVKKSVVDISIKKLNDEKRIIYGWLSVAKDADGNPVVDHHGDVIDSEDLEEAAYDFVECSRLAGEMHKSTDGIGVLVESCYFNKEKKQEFGMEGASEGWWVGFKIYDDDVWASVKSGKYSMLSIGGVATPEDIE